MVSSGTWNFSLNIEEIIAKAYELVGGELESGEALKQARISLGLLFIDLQNRGHPLGKLKNAQLTVTSAVSTYSLSAQTVDVMDMVLHRNGVDTPMQRISLFDYHQLPKKTQTGRPVQWATDREENDITLYVYLTPDNSTDVLDYWFVERVEDAGAFVNTADFSYRYLPAIIVGLAYFLSLEKKESSNQQFMGASPIAQKRQELKALYLELLTAAFSEDTERASFQLVPYGYHKRF